MNLILGGTHGLGAEIAKSLQETGEETFVTGRSYDESKHGRGMSIDLANEDEVDELTRIIQDVGEITLKRFFWVSGYGYNGDFATQSDPQGMADVNFSHVMPIAQAAWNRLLRADESTNFVVVSSMTGIKARPDEAVYAATKFAQVGFTKSLGLESERLDTSARVALFLPGGMQTPFWEGKEPEAYKDFLDPAKVAERIAQRVIEQKDFFYEEEIPRGSL